MNTLHKGLIISGLVAVFIILFFVLGSRSDSLVPEGMFLNEQGEISTENSLVATGDTFDVEYTCAGDNTFMTRYNFGVNTLTVEVNEEVFELEQKVDRVGARYGTRDDSVVFFEAEGVATLITPNIEFESCVGSQL